MSETKNLLVAIVLSTIVLIAWKMFFEEKYLPPTKEIITETTQDINIVYDKKDALLKDSRVTIESDKIIGSINLTGALIDDIKLKDYKETTIDDSDNITLLSPKNTKDSYFTEFGWLTKDSNIKTPNKNTVWIANKKSITPGDPLTLEWTNDQNVTFYLKFNIDYNYIITVTQSIKNNSAENLDIIHYGRINRLKDLSGTTYIISHEGVSGVLNNHLFEITYKDLQKDTDTVIYKNNTSKDGWFGFSDKYWTTAFIPSKDHVLNVNAHHSIQNKENNFQVDYSLFPTIIEKGTEFSVSNSLFVGAKELDILDAYKDQLDIDLFDRVVDFGVLYFITKPIFITLKFINHLIENFGISILILTVIIKLLLLPITNKSYTSISKMKILSPELSKLKKLYAHDKQELQKATMNLFKKHNVNPMAGCLPIILQIPVFFALYKVLFITIDMRHADFYLWIKDLSAPDPTNLFTLFGLLEWNPPQLLHLGILPIILGATMVLQQKVSGSAINAQDNIQKNMLKFMPYVFTFIFASFPAGLIIYWTWSNILSILQQYLITKRTAHKDSK